MDLLHGSGSKFVIDIVIVMSCHVSYHGYPVIISHLHATASQIHCCNYHQQVFIKGGCQVTDEVIGVHTSPYVIKIIS